MAEDLIQTYTTFAHTLISASVGKFKSNSLYLTLKGLITTASNNTFDFFHSSEKTSLDISCALLCH